MGESTRAQSKGYPGTPRDGAAIEINGLAKSALRFVLELHEKGKFKYTKTPTSNGDEISFKDWNDLLQRNFERAYFVPVDPSDDSNYDVDSSIVNRRGIYKDLYKSGKPYEDYQLRPNFAIALTVAPELFELSHALSALDIADKVLRGPLGMKTLDPSDLNYRPYYNNAEDSTDFATSKGRNYHQGPEWVWVFGYFIRAFYKFKVQELKLQKQDTASPTELYQALFYRLNGHREWIRDSEWAGLTELTNKDGELCHDSSPTQAWSTSCLLDLYLDILR
jgi:glycogen debranching enzyme